MLAGHMEYPTLWLKKHEERRLLAGHLWVFSNEVDTAKTPLGDFAPGDPALVMSWRSKPLGVGYVNPGSLIACRLCARRPSARLDAAWLRSRLGQALKLRQRLYPSPHYRAVYGEGDYLPGLVVDRYDTVLAVQLLTAGMEKLRPQVLEILDELFSPSVIVLRGDVRSRQLEGLPLTVEVVKGEVPEAIEVPEGPGRYAAPFTTGQKTGWFFDQRENRLRILPMVTGARVLDVFSYVGALGVGSALAGAKEVICLDSSGLAVDQALANAKANGVGDKVTAVKAEAAEALEGLYSEGRQFDLISLDPPAFIKRKKDLEAGLGAYYKINRLAAKLLAPGGLLLTASCSQHLEAREFQHISAKALAGSGRPKLLVRGGQGPDHPIHPAMPETDYLKSLLYTLAKDEAISSSLSQETQ
jgi:23S rRNA (cytosine1962-C5)-methyltransferase